MKAKTTKFLAVFAVLVMAFAAVAIFAPEENDATAEKSVWELTPVAPATKSSITLGADVIVPTDGQTIEGGKAYYVNSDMTLNVSKDADTKTTGAALIFLKKGVVLNTVTPEKHSKEIVISFLGCTESTNAAGDTVLTLYSDYHETKIVNWVDANSQLKFPTRYPGEGAETDWAAGNYVLGYNPDNGGNVGFMSSTLVSDETKDGIFQCYADTEDAITGNVNLFGEFLYAFQALAVDQTWEIKDANGVIGSLNGNNKLNLDNFTGIIKMTAAGAIEITKWISGEFTVTKGSISGNVLIPAGSEIKYEQGAKILSGQVFSFQGVMDDSYDKTVTDIYKFENWTTDVAAGAGGFVISPGVNGFELRGNIESIGEGAVNWGFTGAAFFTGSIDSKTHVTITADQQGYDFTFGSATIYTATADGLTLDGSFAVQNGAVLTVNKIMKIKANDVLKVGENAYVRVYGDMVLNEGAQVYTAGNIVADTVKMGGAIVDVKTSLAGSVYYYKDGSLTGSNVLFTLVDEARMANVILTGRGDLGVNGVTVISNTAAKGGFYNYSCMVFYPVATQDVLNLAAESRIVGGITPVADISESDVNIALWYAKYKINYDTATPLFVIEYKETYEVIVDDAGTDYTIADSKGTQVYTYVDDGKTKAKLIFGETYSLNGMVSTSKYTYTSTINADAVVQPMNFVDNLQTTFTMVRAAIVQEIDVVVGEEQTITVTLNQPENDLVFAAGDKILEYSTNGGESTTDVVLTTKNNALIGTFKVFNTDKVLVKFVDQKYFKNDVTTVVPETDFITDITAAEITQKAAIKAKGYTFAFQGVTDKTTGTFKVTYSLNEKNDLYKLVDADNLVGNLQLTITFQDYYKGNSGHNQSYSFKPSTGEEGAGIPNNVKTFVGETYTMEWTDLSEVRETMNYMEGQTKKTYVEDSVVSIGSEASTTYTLTLTKIYYASVQNAATKDFTVSDGMGNSVTVEVGKTEAKAVEITRTLVEGATVADNYYNCTVTLTLEVTGAYIRSWSYAIYTDSTSTEPLDEGETVSLPTAVIDVDQDIANKVIRITKLEVIPILYLVKTQPDEHAKIAGDYSRAGYYGDKMFVYVNVEAGFSVTGVEVFYEDPEHEGFPGDKYTDAQKDSSLDQGDFWWYMMPASNVVLIPTTTSDYATVTFKNYDGTVLQGPTKVLKGTTPEYTGDIPTKPATETETYRFAGWEPVLAPVTEDTTYVAQFETVAPTSTDVTIFLEKSTNGVKVTLLANDGRFIQDGSIEFTYYYAYELNGKWATGFKTFTAQTGEIGDKSLFQFTVDLSEQERFAETMWIEGTYTSADEAVNAASELIVYQ